MTALSEPAPRVSVILPTYNRAWCLPAAVYSVLAQTFRDLELIIVDDGPDDGTAAFVAQIGDPRVHYLRRSERMGVSRARNLGIERARGALIAFQDSDDEWRPRKLELQVAAFDAHPGAALVTCGFIVPNDFSRSMIRANRPEPVVDISHLVTRRVAGCQCWLTTREALDAIGGFNPTLDCFEDWEVALRLSQRGTVLLVNEPLVVKPQTEGSLYADKHFARNLARILEIQHDLLHADPVAWAMYSNLLGQSYCQAGALRDGRRWFWRALKARPLSPRTWANLLMSAAGARAFGKYLKLARSLRMRFAPPVVQQV